MTVTISPAEASRVAIPYTPNQGPAVYSFDIAHDGSSGYTDVIAAKTGKAIAIVGGSWTGSGIAKFRSGASGRAQFMPSPWLMEIDKPIFVGEVGDKIQMDASVAITGTVYYQYTDRFEVGA